MFFKQVLITLFLLIAFSSGYAQTPNQYGLQVINNRKDYLAAIALDSNARLLEINKFIPNIKLDIRYATTHNFAGRAVYDEARAFGRLPVVMALRSVQEELNEKGLGLKIYDAYRPYSVTVKFFEIAEDKNFVANPKTGSRHNRGCAIDLTLIKLRNGKELRMPTAYDSFAPEASPAFNDLSRRKKANREILIKVMEKHGFNVLHNEWWHFDFTNWKEFDLMDIPFKQL